MPDPTAAQETLLELETRHEDLLERLDELDKRVEHVLAKYRRDPHRPSPPAAPGDC